MQFQWFFGYSSSIFVLDFTLGFFPFMSDQNRVSWVRVFFTSQCADGHGALRVASRNTSHMVIWYKQLPSRRIASW